jgi:hypothetical protein
MNQKRMMMRILTATVLMLSLLSLSFANAGEEDALLALERIRTSIDSGISYDEYCHFLADARRQIDLLKQSKKPEENFSSFLRAVQLSYQGYDVGKIIWDSMIVLEAAETLDQGNPDQRLLREKLSGEIRIREKDIRKVWWAAGQSLDLAYERRGQDGL